MERNNEHTIENTDNSSDENGDHKTRTKFQLSVEIPLFLSFLAISIAGAPTSNLIMYRTCVHSLNHPMAECQSFLAPGKSNHSQELEDEVQKYATFVGTVKSVLESVVPAVLSVFVGTWSDKHGRRPLLLWPLLGMFMTYAAVVVYSMLPALGPWWYLVTVIPFSLSGGFVFLVTGALCYVNDTSTEEKKSMRLLYIQISITISSALGSWLCPFLLKGVGNMTYLLLVVGAILAVAYTFTVVCVQESLRTATPGTILTVLDINHVKEMIYVCLKKKPNYGRAISLIVVIASALSIFTTVGIAGLLYLFTRNKIHWTLKDFTTYSAISTAMWFVGAIFAIGVLQRVFRIKDISFTIIAFLCCIFEYFIKAFATKTWHMYFGSAVSLFGTVSGPLLRSIQSKVLPAAEVAKIFALQTSAEAVCPLLAPIIYNTLYACTIKSFPGAFYLVSGGINIVCVVLMLIVAYLRWKTSNRSYQAINAESDD